MEFQGFPKLHRLSRDVIITEKIDGTNACVVIQPYDGDRDDIDSLPRPVAVLDETETTPVLGMYAQSRTRIITPDDDNFGFAAWVKENADELFKLGEGRHFGEWWGRGIQRGYGLSHKYFSLFNTGRYKFGVQPACCQVVPVLYKGPFNTEGVDVSMYVLKTYGSKAAPGFMRPEGVVVFHTAASVGFKKTIEHDNIPKSLVQADVTFEQRDY